ncbi:Unconventional myosinIXblike, partial [Caligus rogercresseyi]
SQVITPQPWAQQAPASPASPWPFSTTPCDMPQTASSESWTCLASRTPSPHAWNTSASTSARKPCSTFTTRTSSSPASSPVGTKGSSRISSWTMWTTYPALISYHHS